MVVVLATGSTSGVIDEGSYSAPGRRYAPNAIIVKLGGKVAGSLESQLALKKPPGEVRLSANLDALNARYGVREMKAVFKDFKKHRRRMEALQQKDTRLLTEKEQHILQRLKRAPKGAKVPDLSRIYKLELDLGPGQSLEEAVAAYESDPDVEYAELNYIVSIDLTPDDPLYPLEWSLHNVGQTYPASGRYNWPPGTPDCDIDAPEAWDISTGSSEVIVAVLDCGVDYIHRDLQDNMWTDGDGHYGYDFINNDDDPMDDAGHGTHCAGTIAAQTGNGLDVAGVCWNARIMALKFLGSDGHGEIDDAVDAFYYAVDNGADVVSNSWGGGDYSQAAQDAIDYAYSQGVIIVASAGNDNTDSPQYPAYYNHVIAVAATNSNDQKAGFSNYGNWVDIAAPGVDILSLRAGEGWMGSHYDDYTTIMSGTSMACPHVAGGCALMLSHDPEILIDDLEQVLLESTDAISPEICASGRLNVHEALLLMPLPEGRIWLDSYVCSCSELIGIMVSDSDLKGNGTQEVTVASGGGDYESVVLTENPPPLLGVFTGTISTGSGNPDVEDGTLQVAHGQIITATYYDADYGGSGPVTVEATATADCAGPTIFNVQIDAVGPEPTVTFDTDEPTTARVLCGSVCGGPYTIEGIDPGLATTHTIELTGVQPWTDYFFVIEANDVVGNESLNDNAGACFTFATEGPIEIYVPSQYPTIQEGIDRSWDTGTVWVADGTYTGSGNRDIDFRARAITVKSENGPNNCIIDCQASVFDRHRGFKFVRGEDANSVLDGFTITNGYTSTGGGVYCWQSSPTIVNCVFQGNTVFRGGTGFGGALYLGESGSTLLNCAFYDNAVDAAGGGVACYSWHGQIVSATNCRFYGNIATWGTATWMMGGGMFCDGDMTIELSNCIFSGNRVTGYFGAGGGLCCSGCSAIVTNCVFSGNRCDYTGGGMHISWACNATVANCTFSDNRAGSGAGGFQNKISDHAVDATVINCILWGNTDPQIQGLATVTYSDVEGGYAGEGNIDMNPRFAAPGHWDGDSWVDGDYHLQWDSPCANAGDPNGDYAGQTDIDGEPRVMNGRVEMGPDELDIQTPIIQASPAAPEFFSVAGDPNPDPQILCIRNSGLDTLHWTITYDCDWLEVSSVSGVSTGECDNVSLSVDTAALTPGEYSCVLTIWADGAINSPESVEVNLTHGGAILRVPTPEYPTIQAAIDDAMYRDEVIVADGVYTGPNNCDVNFLGKPITVRSENGPENCIIDCEYNAAGFVLATYEERNSTLDGFTIINSGGQCHQAGIFIRGASPTIINCKVLDGDNSSGIYCQNGTPLISQCLISGNDNYGAQNCRENRAFTGWGGGILCYYANAIIRNCMILDNSGKAGGGIAVRMSSPTIENCLITGNTAGQSGGCLYVGSGRPTLINCTVLNNSADQGGAVYIDCGMGCKPDITNSILRGNIPDEVYDTYHYQPPVITYCNIEGGWPGEGNIDVDPLFRDPASGDYHLRCDSPCVGTGDPDFEYVDQTDMDGEARLMGACVDMGADERLLAPVIAVSSQEVDLFSPGPGIDRVGQIVSIYNLGCDMLSWEISVPNDCGWLRVYPLTGQSSNEYDQVPTHISVDTAGLTYGEYNCMLTIWAPALNSPQTVSVNLSIRPPIIVPTPEHPTIQAAIDAAINGDVVLVADGTYTGPGNRDIDFGGKAISVRSENGPANCIINCQGSAAEPHRAFYFHSGEGPSAVVEGFTITNGYAPFGAGILSENSSPTISGCVFNNNSAVFGGGLYNQDCSATVVNCIFSNNTAFDGAGVDNEYGSPKLINCTFIANTANFSGGAVLNYETVATIANCIMWGGTPEEIFVESGNTTVIYSDVEGGFAGEGNIDADPLFADAASGDYHLLPGSAAIDAGNPGSDWGNERWPNGFRVNMGGYGNTCEATRSRADFEDLAVLASYWLTDEALVDIAPEPDGDGIANFLDFAAFAEYWRSGQ
jgi:hypothetical protein